ncbi:MAG: PAS domain-containing protein, partial [Acidimicrobiia bacterium]
MTLHLLGEQVEELYEHAPCGLLSTNVSGRVVGVNQTFLDWSGYDWDQVNGRLFADLLDVRNRAYYETRCVPVLHLDGEMREVALHLQRADGTTLPILVNSTLQCSVDGRPESMQFAIFDARRRQDYERELLVARRIAERSEAQVRLLQHASVALGTVTSETAVVAALAEIAGLATGATTAVMLAEPGTRVLRSAMPGSNPLGDVVAFDDARPESDAIRSGRPVIVSDSDAPHRYPT